jgi:diacylglycerol O-acyltransferase / wax synthase
MQRMTGIDASFLYLETPAMPMHVGLLVLMEPRPGTYDYAEVYRRLEAAAHTEPMLALQVAAVPFSLDHPRWVHGSELDVLHHVRRVTCPGAGSRADLCGVVERALATPLDRARPLWEVWVIEGLAEGRYALLVKVHHALTDGAAGMQLMARLFGPARKPPEGPANDVASEQGERLDPITLLGDGLRARLGAARDLVRLARRTRGALGELFARRRADPSLSGGTLLSAPRAPWNQPIGRERVAVLAEVHADQIRDVRKQLGVTANELLLGICAGALRAYLMRHRALPDRPLTAACPVPTRVDARAHNHISALVVSLATDEADPCARVRAVARSAQLAQAEHSSLGADMLASWAELSAPALVQGAVRLYGDYGIAAHHPPLYNLSISNVPGPRKALSFAGAPVVAAYPLGPVVDGVGLNVTMLSYAGVYCIGLVAARAAFPDLGELEADIARATAELQEAARAERGHAPGLAEKH